MAFGGSVSGLSSEFFGELPYSISFSDLTRTTYQQRFSSGILFPCLQIAEKALNRLAISALSAVMAPSRVLQDAVSVRHASPKSALDQK